MSIKDQLQQELGKYTSGGPYAVSVQEDEKTLTCDIAEANPLAYRIDRFVPPVRPQHRVEAYLFAQSTHRLGGIPCAEGHRATHPTQDCKSECCPDCSPLVSVCLGVQIRLRTVREGPGHTTALC